MISLPRKRLLFKSFKRKILKRKIPCTEKVAREAWATWTEPPLSERGHQEGVDVPVVTSELVSERARTLLSAPSPLGGAEQGDGGEELLFCKC